LRRRATSTLVAYTTLFRSRGEGAHADHPAKAGSATYGISTRPSTKPWAWSRQESDSSRTDPTSGRPPARRDPHALRSWRRSSARSEEHTSELQSRENLVCR